MPTGNKDLPPMGTPSHQRVLLRFADLLLDIMGSEIILWHFLEGAIGKRDTAAITRGQSPQASFWEAASYLDRTGHLDRALIAELIEHYPRKHGDLWQIARDLALPGAPAAGEEPRAPIRVRRSPRPSKPRFHPWMLFASMVPVVLVAHVADGAPGRPYFILAAAFCCPVGLYALATRQRGPFYTAVAGSLWSLPRTRQLEAGPDVATAAATNSGIKLALGLGAIFAGTGVNEQLHTNAVSPSARAPAISARDPADSPTRHPPLPLPDAFAVEAAESPALTGSVTPPRRGPETKPARPTKSEPTQQAKPDPAVPAAEIHRALVASDYDAAITACRALLAIVPTHSQEAGYARFTLADIHETKRGDPKAAIRLYDECFELGCSGFEEDAHLGLIRSLKRAGKAAAAESAMERYKRAFPKGKYLRIAADELRRPTSPN